MTSATRTPTRVELMKILDENFVSTAVMFEESTLVTSVVIDGKTARTADGAIDRQQIERVVARAINAAPSLRLRLRNTPLGLTAPAWVDAGEPEIAYHLRFADSNLGNGLSEGAILSGRANGAMRMDRPLWDVLVSDLESGDVSVIVRAQHAYGDGMYGLRLLGAMSSGEPVELESAFIEPSQVRGPRTGIGVLWQAYREWLAEFPLGAAAWSEYWRKPFNRRIKRWGGRVLRPSRRRAALSAGLPVHLSEREYRVVRFDFRAARARAREFGGSVNDLVVASTLRALTSLGSDDVSIVVPISRKADRSGDERNHVSMAPVTATSGQSFEELMASAHAQIDHVRNGGVAEMPSTTPVGYATYLPWSLRPQYLGRSLITSATMWPTIAPDAQIGLLAASYLDTISFAIIANREIDIDALVDALHEDISPRVSEPS